MRAFIRRRNPFRSGGQATTEVVLLFPIFLFFLLAIAKIFALLVLVQKLEIASYYAARRWQLESHRSITYTSADDSTLRSDIQDKITEYMIGKNNSTTKKFLGVNQVIFEKPVRTQVWNIVTVKVTTSPAGIKLLCKYDMAKACASPYGEYCRTGYKFLCTSGATLEVVKYVPNRDRPIQFELPGLQ